MTWYIESIEGWQHPNHHKHTRKTNSFIRLLELNSEQSTSVSLAVDTEFENPTFST